MKTIRQENWQLKHGGLERSRLVLWLKCWSTSSLLGSKSNSRLSSNHQKLFQTRASSHRSRPVTEQETLGGRFMSSFWPWSLWVFLWSSWNYWAFLGSPGDFSFRSKDPNWSWGNEPATRRRWSIRFMRCWVKWSSDIFDSVIHFHFFLKVILSWTQYGQCVFIFF